MLLKYKGEIRKPLHIKKVYSYACNDLRAVWESELVVCVQSLKTFTAYLSIFKNVHLYIPKKYLTYTDRQFSKLIKL